ncbi:MAG: hypothetical protein ABIH92_06005 [Nanoarchaeota archaeon]
MEETVNLNKVYAEILVIRKEIDFIKSRVMDLEIIMEPEEEAQLDEALEYHKKGKTKRLEDLKKELGD